MKWLYELYPAPQTAETTEILKDGPTNSNGDIQLCYGYRADNHLFSAKSDFQQVDIIENPFYGRALFLDSLMMTTEKDEFVYHELMTHVPMSSIKNPERILVIGGGDGGIARELCKYESVKEIIVAEIDGMVVEASKKFLPSIAKGFEDPRVDVKILDGIEYVKQQPDSVFDLVVVDSTDPIGPGVVLFSEEFYRHCHRVIKPGGHFSAQAMSPIVHAEAQKEMYNNLNKVFPVVKPYIGTVPTYPAALWLFVHAGASSADSAHPPKGLRGAFDVLNKLPQDLKYVNEDILRSCYSLPQFIKKNLGI